MLACPNLSISEIVADFEKSAELKGFLDDTLLPAAVACCIGEFRFGEMHPTLPRSESQAALEKSVCAEAEAEIKSAILDAIRRVLIRHGMSDQPRF